MVHLLTTNWQRAHTIALRRARICDDRVHNATSPNLLGDRATLDSSATAAAKSVCKRTGDFASPEGVGMYPETSLLGHETTYRTGRPAWHLAVNDGGQSFAIIAASFYGPAYWIFHHCRGLSYSSPRFWRECSFVSGSIFRLASDYRVSDRCSH
jgi:hypothetical protein